MSKPPHHSTERAPESKIAVLVADDHVTVLEGLAAIIGRQPDMVVVALAADGRQAVESWTKHRPDVTLMDLSMPRLTGVEAIASIRAVDQGARIIVLSSYDTDADILNAFKAGARAYLMKDCGREEILECVRTVHRGEISLPPALVTKLAYSLSDESLTHREAEVLARVAQGKSNKEISASLYLSETTVKSHLGSVFRKLRVLSRTEAMAEGSRRGLIKV